MGVKIVACRCDARGLPVGESHHTVRHSDAVVAEVRAMAEAGATDFAIALQTGIPRRTVRCWIDGSRRGARWVKTIMRRQVSK